MTLELGLNIFLICTLQKKEEYPKEPPEPLENY
jgi:hypothetical protein